MSKYHVKVRVTRLLKEPMTIYSSDPISAQEKAEEIVSGWEGVEEAEAVSAEEIG